MIRRQFLSSAAAVLSSHLTFEKKQNVQVGQLTTDRFQQPE
jgi:hypothetical protein